MQILVPAAVAAIAVLAGSVITATPSRPPEAVRPAVATLTGTPLPGTTLTGTTLPGTTLTGPTRRTSPPAALADAGAPSRPGSGPLAWPLAPRPAVRRLFDQPRSQWSGGHRGVDLLATVGQPVLSAGDGVVAFSGVIAGRGVITIAHQGGLRTTYEPVGQRLRSGARVHRGTPIGVISPTAGHCAPLTCLHWGAISAATYRDPLLLVGVGRPVLLPLG